MDAKIRELTDKIFNEGVEKGKQQANQIIADAQSKSEQLIASAKEEADRIVTTAEKKASELKKNTESELKLYSGQTLVSIKSTIADLITDKIIQENIKAATVDPDFMRNVILRIVSNWNASEGLVIETNNAKELEAYFASNAKELLDKGIEFNEVAGNATHFTLKPKDGSYKIEFGETELKDYFKGFLRPRLVEMLF